jgi:hypothetical protein
MLSKNFLSSSKPSWINQVKPYSLHQRDKPANSQPRSSSTFYSTYQYTFSRCPSCCWSESAENWAHASWRYREPKWIARCHCFEVGTAIGSNL